MHTRGATLALPAGFTHCETAGFHACRHRPHRKLMHRLLKWTVNVG